MTSDSRYSLLHMSAKRAIFVGSKTFGLEIFKVLFDSPFETTWVVVHPDDERDSRSCLSEWKQFTESRNIPFHVARSNSELFNIIEDFEPDIGMVCGWYRIVESSLLEKLPLGLWGIHNSLLPKYRGGSPLVWSIIHGDSEVGSSVFKFDSGIDSGPVLFQVAVRNTPSLTIADLLAQIQGLLVDRLPDAWSQLVSGTAVGLIQNESEATYCGQRIETDGEINWFESATRIHNFIRALAHPYPGAFSEFEGKRLFLSETSVMSESYFGTPGQVLRRSSDHVVISCGGNSGLRVRSVAIDGVRLPAPRILTSISCRLGRSSFKHLS